MTKDGKAGEVKDLYHEHIDITKEVKHSIEKQKVVFPAQYGKLYHDISHKHGIELKPTELLTREMLDEQMVRHVITLVDCTDQAIGAIEEENKDLLRMILLKTKQLQEEINELQKIVYEDSLTKSYNRKWFEDTILDQDKFNVRGGGTIVMVDLNKFKEINDNYGHVIGDKVLIHLALKLKESGGRVVRYGGDEFIVIFDEKFSTQQIEAKMEKLLEYFQKVQFKVEEHSFKIAFAYGMASFRQGSNLNSVIDTADKAMYHNKFLQKKKGK